MDLVGTVTRRSIAKYTMVAFAEDIKAVIDKETTRISHLSRALHGGCYCRSR
ncbi:hypothetical protein OH492_18195 [Vibrio chagasii]|nr:hypothetical protein [Vibrio chagasii]